MNSIHIDAHASASWSNHIQINNIAATGMQLYRDTIARINTSIIPFRTSTHFPTHSRTINESYFIEQINRNYLVAASPEYISRHVRRLENIEQHGAVKIPDTISTPEEFYQWILQTSKANR